MLTISNKVFCIRFV